MKKENNGRPNFNVTCKLCQEDINYWASIPAFFKITGERVLLCPKCAKKIEAHNLKDYRLIKNG